jgi:hypothetical protein
MAEQQAESMLQYIHLSREIWRASQCWPVQSIHVNLIKKQAQRSSPSDRVDLNRCCATSERVLLPMTVGLRARRARQVQRAETSSEGTETGTPSALVVTGRPRRREVADSRQGPGMWWRHHAGQYCAKSRLRGSFASLSGRWALSVER